LCALPISQQRRPNYHAKAVAVEMPRPAAGRKKQERAQSRRGIQQAEHAWPTKSLRDRREQGQRHAKGHRDDVDDVGADQLRAAPRVAEALDDTPKAWALRIDRRWYRL